MTEQTRYPLKHLYLPSARRIAPLLGYSAGSDGQHWAHQSRIMSMANQAWTLNSRCCGVDQRNWMTGEQDGVIFETGYICSIVCLLTVAPGLPVAPGRPWGTDADQPGVSWLVRSVVFTTFHVLTLLFWKSSFVKAGRHFHIPKWHCEKRCMPWRTR